MGMTIDTSLLYESGYNKGFKDGIKGSIPKADYKNRLRADMVAMLTEIQLEIEEFWGTISPNYDEAAQDISKVIQRKINELKEAAEDNEQSKDM